MMWGTDVLDRGLDSKQEVGVKGQPHRFKQKQEKTNMLLAQQ